MKDAAPDDMSLLDSAEPKHRPRCAGEAISAAQRPRLAVVSRVASYLAVVFG